MARRNTYQHVFTRDVPVEIKAAFDWMTDYSQEDMRFYDSESGSRSFERLAPDKIRLITVEKERRHNIRIEGIVTLSPPKHWTYTGVMLRDAKAIASFNEYFSLEALDHEMTRFTIRLEAKPLTVSFRLYTTLFRRKLDEWLDKPHDRIVRAMVSECGANNMLAKAGA
ncbi:MAG: hypothetical protein JRN52_16325 [Nitrososphaerota archaeon]|nr:hypothetical protein [Nitrososphaerota archaeon]